MIIFKKGEPHIVFGQGEIRFIRKDSHPDDPTIWQVTIETHDGCYTFDMLRKFGRFPHLTDYHFAESYREFSMLECHAVFNIKYKKLLKALYSIVD